MSRSKKDRSFPHGLGLSSDEQLAEIIAAALREDFGDTPSSIKAIGRLTSANLRAIKNWYSGENAPSSRYLLILARNSPSILRFILMQVGGEDLWDVFELFHRHKPKADTTPDRTKRKPGRPALLQNNTSNISDKTNERTAWFADQLAAGEKLRTRNLAEHWQVDFQTAQRDIACLVRSGQAVFRGARRNGWYERVQ
jgi:hypothetical protein